MILPVLLSNPLLSDPPLDPSGDEARSWLRRELLKPEYNDQNLVQRLLHAIERLLDKGINAASGSSTLTTLMSMLLLVVLVVALGLLVAQARRAGARKAAGDHGVLTDEEVTADDLRARAEAALADGRPADALVDGFRALTLRQVEQKRLEDLPGATAHEVALALQTAYPQERERVRRAADLFDSVMYGGRPATPDQARGVLALDDALGGRVAPAAGRGSS